MEHHYRQSFLNDFMMCPEKARRKRAGEVPDRTNDSALFGTALHEGIELVVQGHIDGVGVTMQQAVELCQTTLADGNEKNPPFEKSFRTLGTPKKMETLDSLQAKLERGIQSWWGNFHEPFIKTGIVRPVEVERPFDVLLDSRELRCPCMTIRETMDGEVVCSSCCETGKVTRELYVQGTIDMVAENAEGATLMYDWKTAAGKYGGSSGWKHERYSIQPTVYFASSIPAESMIFTFVRIGRDNSEFEMFQVERNTADVEFLIDQLHALATLDEARLPVWPLGPTDWHCSAKWCPAWTECRGKYLGLDPWDNLPSFIVEQLEKADADGNSSELVAQQSGSGRRVDEGASPDQLDVRVERSGS